MKTLNRLIGLLAAVCILMCMSACIFDPAPATTTTTTAAPVPVETKPPIDPDVSEVLCNFYQNELPALTLRSGLKDTNGEEIRCDLSMVQKSVFVDFDADGSKEIVILYDVSERVGESNLDVVVFVDEQDGKAVIVSSESGSYGASKEDEAYILTRYDSRICKVRFINKETYEVALIEVFEDGAWKTTTTAYRHVSDHDGIKLESDSCYIDHAGGDLFDAVQGKTFYSKEKLVNFRTPNENYNSLITALLAETVLP